MDSEQGAHERGEYQWQTHAFGAQSNAEAQRLCDLLSSAVENGDRVVVLLGVQLRERQRNTRALVGAFDRPFAKQVSLILSCAQTDMDQSGKGMG